MPAVQQLLFPDPKPLVERLGSDFFRQLPERPGIYLMRDALGVVLYIGKAKNLRKRLGSYRVANPDRMPRRHLRLLSAVIRIEIEECADERSALAREAQLLRTVRPPFNRAGTWRPPPRFLAWRCLEQRLHLTITETPSDAWRFRGPVRGPARALRDVLARLLWLAAHSAVPLVSLPLGWARQVLEAEIVIDCGVAIDMTALNLEQLLDGGVAEFCDWIRAQRPRDPHPFEKMVLEADLAWLTDTLPPATDH